MDIPSLRRYVAASRTTRRVVLVPTMGALHDGHRACVDVALTEPDALTIVSIFVNPTQFGPGEDFASYPRPIDDDVELCRQWGVHAVFAPSAAEMYPHAQVAWVDVDTVSEPLCGATRPGHFRGVATVVSKLFNVVRPDVAVFGQKDAQQALVIRAFTRQLNFPIELRLARTAREDDGLARSSRNAYLDGLDRERAAGIYRSFVGIHKSIVDGERNARSVEQRMRALLGAEGIDDIDYVEVRTADNLSALERIEGRVILAVAVRVGTTRLIDNVVADVQGGVVEWDVDLFERRTG